MIMAARSLLHCAAGMEHRRAFADRHAGHLEFFKSCGWNSRNFRPTDDFVREDAAAQAKPPIRLNVGVLQGKKLQRELVESAFAPVGGVNVLAEPRAVFGK